MKTSTKILFISMLFSAVIPSLLLSSEKEKNREGLGETDTPEFTIGPGLTITTKSGIKFKFYTESGPQETVSTKFLSPFTTEAGEKKSTYFLQPLLQNFKACQLAYYVIQGDKENFIKTLDENTDPNHKLETSADSSSFWKELNGVTPLEIAYLKYINNPNQTTSKILQLLRQKSNVSQEQQKYSTKFMPLPLKF